MTPDVLHLSVVDGPGGARIRAFERDGRAGASISDRSREAVRVPAAALPWMQTIAGLAVVAPIPAPLVVRWFVQVEAALVQGAPSQATSHGLASLKTDPELLETESTRLIETTQDANGKL